MDLATLRKPRLDFDVAANPSHIALDDAKEQRRNIPWLHYTKARWEYDDPDPILMEIRECCVVIRESSETSRVAPMPAISPIAAACRGVSGFGSGFMPAVPQVFARSRRQKASAGPERAGR